MDNGDYTHPDGWYSVGRVSIVIGVFLPMLEYVLRVLPMKCYLHW